MAISFSSPFESFSATKRSPRNPFLTLNNKSKSVSTVAIKSSNKIFGMIVPLPRTNVRIKIPTMAAVSAKRRLPRYNARINFTLAWYFYFVYNLGNHFIGINAFHFFFRAQHNAMAQHGCSYELDIFRVYKVAAI